MRTRPIRPLVLFVALALAASACGDGGTEKAEQAPAQELSVAIASYETVAGRDDQRVLLGVFASDQSGALGFGEVDVEFTFTGTGREAERGTSFEEQGTFLPLPGQQLTPEQLRGPARMVKPSEATGVYAVDGVRFEEAGVWDVAVTARVDGAETRASAKLQVLEKPGVPYPGDPAPRTRNPLPGAEDVPLKAIDSAAEEGQPLHDAELHKTTVADAIAANKPVMVVVSTPAFCQSRFCGPVTDAVADVARRYGDRMAFVHLEVWRDFEKQEVNAAAAEWIIPQGGAGDANEPWVFVVGADGNIAQRWDNVASDAELDAAAKAAAGG